MIRIRRSADRGITKTDWLSGRHSFSFAHYDDPEYRAFRSLRVINQDVVQPGTGFGMHSHHNMEIITYILRGELEHRDSLGNIQRLKAGDLQRMSAGTGIRHSEYNPSAQSDLELLQIWIEPDTAILPPSYEDAPMKATPDEPLTLVAAPSDGILKVHQDVRLYRGVLANQTSFSLPITQNRHAWVQVISGEVEIKNQTLVAGDAMAISAERSLSMNCRQACEFLLFDLG